MKRHVMEVRGPDSVELFKALASEMRVKILQLLGEHNMNINELAQALGIAQPTVTKHAQILEQMGLIKCEYMPGSQGMQKRCSLSFEKFIVDFETKKVPEHQILETEMPVGLYTMVHATPTCGLMSPEHLIGIVDDPQAFYHPDRAAANHIWMADGFVEYVFPCGIPTSSKIHKFELLMEVCSESPDYNNDYPSDITIWINNVEIGTWTSPGDFGGKRGRFSPDWWWDNWTQYGMSKLWSVDEDGSYIDGAPISYVSLNKIKLAPFEPITVRIGIKPDAVHRGGLNLFGKGCGNYDQDIVMRLHYSTCNDSSKIAYSSENTEAMANAEKV